MNKKLLLIAGLVLLFLLPVFIPENVLAQILSCNIPYNEATRGSCPPGCTKQYNIESATFTCVGSPTVNNNQVVIDNPSGSNGTIKNPVLDPNVGSGQGETILAKILAAIINLFFIAGSIAVLVYLLMGGLAWITSEGDKGKLEIAKNRLTYAAMGIIIIAATFAILKVLGGFLGIDFFKTLIINWPTIT